MKKLKLDLNDLAVTSFHPVSQNTLQAGTVRALLDGDLPENIDPVETSGDDELGIFTQGCTYPDRPFTFTLCTAFRANCGARTY